MKNVLRKSFWLALFFVAFVSKAQLPNGDFTNWVTDTNGRVCPVDWECTFQTLSSPTVLQDTDRLGGAGYSAKLTSVLDSTFGFYFAGEIVQWNIPLTGPNKPIRVNGFWKMPNPNLMDIFTVSVSFFDSMNFQIGFAVAETADSLNYPNWIAFSQDITYTANRPVHNYSIDVFLATFSDDSTVYANIDDLSFDFNVYTEEIQTVNSELRFIEGSKTYIYSLDLISPAPISVSIYDLTGREIKRVFDGRASAGRQTFAIDCNDLRSGIYLCKVLSGNYSETMKLLKQ